MLASLSPLTCRVVVVFRHVPVFAAAYLYDNGPSYGGRAVQPRDQEPRRLCHGVRDKEDAYQHAQRGEMVTDKLVNLLATGAEFDGFLGACWRRKRSPCVHCRLPIVGNGLST